MHLNKVNFVSIKELTEIATENYLLIEKELDATGISKKEILSLLKSSIEEAYLQTPNKKNALSILIAECKKRFINDSLVDEFLQSNIAKNQVPSFTEKEEEVQNKVLSVVIKKLRIQNSYTQEQFYHATGINIKRYESCQCVPKFNTLCRILKYFNISMEKFANLLEQESKKIEV